MKIIMAYGPKDLRLAEAPVPLPGEGQVLIAVRASGICGSDKGYWRRGPSDHVAGHEAAGEVVGLGPGVRRLKIGDRVAVNNVVGCGRCKACRAGRFVHCPRRPGKDVGNGYGEMLVAPACNCLLIDGRIGDVAGCLIFDNWGTPFVALNRAGVQCGDDVVISGCGPIGLAAVALAKQRGAFVIAVDPLPYRLEAATRLGADAVLTPGEHISQAVHDLTEGLGARVVVECSGQGAAYPAMLSSLRNDGSLIAVGEGAQLELNVSEQLIRNHLSILSSWYSDMDDGRAVQDLMLRGQIDPLAFVTHQVSLAEVPEAMARFCRCEDGVLKTVIVMPKR